MEYHKIPKLNKGKRKEQAIPKSKEKDYKN
jgi:hypothetical protein